MKLVLVYSFYFLLVQIALGRARNERHFDNSLNQEYRANRGVTYVKPPSSIPSGSRANSDTKDPPRGNGQNLNYDIFETPDEPAGAGAGGPVRVAPVPSQPTGTQLPPKFGPVLFPDEEAAAQNNGSDSQAENGDKGGQNNQDTKNPATIVNPPQAQEKNQNNGNQNRGQSQQSGNSTGNRGRNSSNPNGNTRPNAPANNSQNGNNSDISNGDKNINNGNGNNGSANGRKRCSFPIDMIFCLLGR